jgi:hypothetical protein
MKRSTRSAPGMSFRVDNGVKIVTFTERQKMVPTHGPEPAYPLLVVLKCGVCLMLLILLTVIGSTGAKSRFAQDARSNASGSAPGARMAGSAAHRKEVFDARRANFSGNATQRDLTGRSLAGRVDADTP